MKLMSLSQNCSRPLLSLAALLAATVGSAQAQNAVAPPSAEGPVRVAQSSSVVNNPGQRSNNISGSSGDYSLLPYTRRGYVGVNLGRPDFSLSCGGGGLACDDPNVAGKVYTGGMFNDFLGLEVGYLNMGGADRAGGKTRAHGANISLVGRLPVASSFSLFGKVGTTYGRTKVSTQPLSGIEGGKDRGWGASYGAGLSYDLNAKSSIVLEWESHDFHFAGEGREAVRNTSLGYVHRF